jgi:lysophospholipase L1-like esterase
VLLGDRFCVRNFGVNGHAVQHAADRPYWSSDAFTASGAFQPDIALMMLGTNDARGGNWKGVDSFSRDYRELVVHYQSLESSPAVWLLTPPALFRVGRSAQVRYGMDDSAILPMCGAIRELATELGCGTIDINEATMHHPELFRLDGVHPGGTGAARIAQAVFAALQGEPSAHC